MSFNETQKGPAWLAFVGTLMLVFLILVSTAVAPGLFVETDRVGGWTIAMLIAAFLVLLAGGAILVTRRITVAVTETHVDAYLSPLRVMHISFTDIDHVYIADARPSQAGGLGWRLAGTDRFLIWSAGPAVWIAMNNGSRRIIRTDHADQLAQAIVAKGESPTLIP